MIKRWLRRPAVIGVVVVVVVGTSGGLAYARKSSATPVTYRTAKATLGTVTQTISLAGNLTPISETDLDFGASGRVLAVNVSAGQTVTAGQVLAVMDTATLQGALAQAQASLASAQAKLTLDQAGPTITAVTSSNGQLRSAQASLAIAQVNLADTVTNNTMALQQAGNATAAARSLLPSDQNAFNAHTTMLRADQAAAHPDPAVIAADNQRVTADLQTLAKDNSAYQTAVAQYSAVQAKNVQAIHLGENQIFTAQVQVQNAQEAMTASQQSVTPQQIAQDQSLVTTAQINVDNAQRTLSEGTITAPTGGIIGAVNITPGQSVTSSVAAATTVTSTPTAATAHNLTLLAPGLFAVTGPVTDSVVNQVALGQRARVTPAGSAQAQTGKVTGISPVATVTSGVATFAVTVTLDDADTSLHAGLSASMTITTNQVAQVLTVPTTAVTTTAGGSTVQLMINGVPKVTPVEVGAADAQRIQVTNGISASDEVVVGTISSAVPTPTPGGNNRGGGGGPGGGGPGGGGGGAGGAARALGG